MGDQSEEKREIQVFEDARGIALIGDSGFLDAWLGEEGIESSTFSIDFAEITGSLGAGAQGAAGVMEASGRWVKLTEESRQMVEKYGNARQMGVLYDENNKFVHQLRFVSHATNPAMMASVGSAMTQMSIMHELEQMKECLASIDQKLDDVIQDQKDTSFSEVYGAQVLIEEAEFVKRSVGTVNGVSWSKIANVSHTLSTQRAYALKKIDNIITRLQKSDSTKKMIDDNPELHREIGTWLSLIGHCLELEYRLANLELARVLEDDSEHFESYKRGLYSTWDQRIQSISERLSVLGSRLVELSTIAGAPKQKLRHPLAVNAMIRSLEQAQELIATFAERAGCDDAIGEISQPLGWIQAAGEVATSTRTKIVDSGKTVATQTGAVTQQALTHAGHARETALRKGNESIRKFTHTIEDKRSSIPLIAGKSSDSAKSANEENLELQDMDNSLDTSPFSEPTAESGE
ncbi:hypothetical protein [Actinomyces vulturis]|uniref:hypothetical protein n=1 Tax=Actinomyces vulturis TaxID=1857645 RepID=UPI000836121B|nr:hypothetical protein [Actinomyces vulturis]